MEQEVMATKINWELRRLEKHKEEVGTLEENDYNDLTDKEKLERMRKENEDKEFYNPINKTIDMRKKPVTDSAVNSKVILPQHMNPKNDAQVNLRRECFTEIVKNDKDILSKLRDLIDYNELEGVINYKNDDVNINISIDKITINTIEFDFHALIIRDIFGFISRDIL